MVSWSPSIDCVSANHSARNSWLARTARSRGVARVVTSSPPSPDRVNMDRPHCASPVTTPSGGVTADLPEALAVWLRLRPDVPGTRVAHPREKPIGLPADEGSWRP
ncbi:effector-associated constant component EACC1 [Amycolatopsis balhimycina]|uniref:effector-associated constant component EACC1 n=1 Tax=Amycolatopsis balhimycina TaxID=208443 RepID=UPI0035E3C643